MVAPEDWRARLRAAVDRTGKKHSYIAHTAGIAPSTLSRVLTGRIPQPSFDHVVKIAHAAGESVGWVLGERAYCLSAEELAKLRQIAASIEALTRERP